jgi:L-fuconolactonase
MRIDAHQHFWTYDPVNYAWISEQMSKLRRDFLPADLHPELQRSALDGTVAVQARQSLLENGFLLNLAHEFPRIRKIVGWVDLRDQKVEEQLSTLARHSLFAGVRHVLQDEPDAFCLSPEFRRGISKLKQFDFTYDLLVFPRQLPACVSLVEAFPEQRFVLDHIGKPSIRDGTFQPWKESIRKLAAAGPVYCKISGLVTEADWNGWKNGDFEAYLDVVMEAFTPARLMFGSDWPVCLLAASYREVLGIVESRLKHYSKEDQARVMGETAADFYKIS